LIFSTLNLFPTTSYEIPTRGDEAFAVGEVRTVDGKRFRVEKMRLRDGRSADRAFAKDIVRVWGASL
ncbi:MAG TPA: HVO_0476 family zinc finger protein, partial [Methanothrix sp.]|nr:HVO_0476 family zinc finger protein [Methanothrix sp.]